VIRAMIIDDSNWINNMATPCIDGFVIRAMRVDDCAVVRFEKELVS